MNKKLLRSVREYKKQSVLAPVLVILEVLMEVLIPLEMAKIIDVGIANGDMSYIIQRGVILVAMAMLSLFFGVQAGNMAAVAAAGYAKNLRHDIFYKVQDLSLIHIFLSEHYRELSVVLLDICMPVCDGFEFLRRRNTDKFLSTIPVIVMTGSNSKDAELQCLDLGAVDFIPKPYNFKLVMGRINSVIKLRESVMALTAVCLLYTSRCV